MRSSIMQFMREVDALKETALTGFFWPLLLFAFLYPLPVFTRLFAGVLPSNCRVILPARFDLALTSRTLAGHNC